LDSKDEKNHQDHMERKQRGRQEKQKDKEDAQKYNHIHTATFFYYFLCHMSHCGNGPYGLS
jgi:hypothetical protein